MRLRLNGKDCTLLVGTWINAASWKIMWRYLKKKQLKWLFSGRTWRMKTGNKELGHLEPGILPCPTRGDNFKVWITGLLKITLWFTEVQGFRWVYLALISSEFTVRPILRGAKIESGNWNQIFLPEWISHSRTF